MGLVPRQEEARELANAFSAVLRVRDVCSPEERPHPLTAPPYSPTEPDHAGAPISDLQQFLLLVGHPLCGILTETVAGGSGVRGALGKGCFLIIIILLLIIIITIDSPVESH